MNGTDIIDRRILYNSECKVEHIFDIECGLWRCKFYRCANDIVENEINGFNLVKV
jgi:hypothetical protein